jgi:hypothetical protein
LMPSPPCQLTNPMNYVKPLWKEIG